jgi:hypothetical protein
MERDRGARGNGEEKDDTCKMQDARCKMRDKRQLRNDLRGARTGRDNHRLPNPLAHPADGLEIDLGGRLGYCRGDLDRWRGPRSFQSAGGACSSIKSTRQIVNFADRSSTADQDPRSWRGIASGPSRARATLFLNRLLFDELR